MTNDELDTLMIRAGMRFGHPFARSHLVTFAKLVEEREREECAVMCEKRVEDDGQTDDFSNGWNGANYGAAAAIRGRGK